MRAGRLRALVLATIAVGGAIAVASVQLAPAQRRVTLVATAHQLGPVSYRDPAGAIAPDGRSIAYSEGRFLRVQPIDGGPAIEFPPGDVQIRHLVWHPSGRTILTDGDGARTWAVYDIGARMRGPLFAGRDTLATPEGMTARVADLRQPSWSADGRSLAALVNARDGMQLWIVSIDGASAVARPIAARVSFPAGLPNGQIACVAAIGGRSRVTIPCGAAPVAIVPDLDVYGPIAFSQDAAVMYAGMPNEGGTLDLWAMPTHGGRAERLTSFSRDTYAPSVSRDGTVAFKVPTYRTVVAVAPAGGGPTRALAAFRSETPSWHPRGHMLGITYGTWRRVIDDANYPDIAQDVGWIGVNTDNPGLTPSVVHASASEDQSLCWSPNGNWIAFHSHKDMSDDVWLRPASQAEPVTRITSLGRGAETGWPRWSPDGRSVLFTAARSGTRETVLYVVGVDQESGRVTETAREIPVRGVSGSMFHGEWLGDSAHIIAIMRTAPGRQTIVTIPREGGDARIVHEIATEHDVPGLAVSPDGRDVAFIAPAADGFFQVFRMPVAGGTPRAVTADRSHKTQPAWSPDGASIAFTVWSYDAEFMTLAAK